MYKNPIKSILSRFVFPLHLKNIQVNPNITIDDVIKRSSDLYGINEFYNNYTKINKKRNYKIYCVKYEDIFLQQNKLSKILNIGNLNLIKKESNRKTIEDKYFDKLNNIYKDLIVTMNKNKFIMIR